MTYAVSRNNNLLCSMTHIGNKENKQNRKCYVHVGKLAEIHNVVNESRSKRMNANKSCFQIEKWKPRKFLCAQLLEYICTQREKIWKTHFCSA